MSIVELKNIEGKIISVDVSKIIKLRNYQKPIYHHEFSIDGVTTATTTEYEAIIYFKNRVGSDHLEVIFSSDAEEILKRFQNVQFYEFKYRQGLIVIQLLDHYVDHETSKLVYEFKGVYKENGSVEYTKEKIRVSQKRRIAKDFNRDAKIFKLDSNRDATFTAIMQCENHMKNEVDIFLGITERQNRRRTDMVIPR